jgi:DNA end-binding protein Ku
MHPYWKGYLKLALVSCPIALHAERISFRRINTVGNRLRKQLVDEETREPVNPEGRVYEVAKRQCLVVELGRAP